MKYEDELNNCRQEIEDIKKRIDKNKFDSSVKYLVRYAIIRASGNIETIFKDMLFEYVNYGCSPRAYNFLNKNIKKNPCNPSIYHIKKLLRLIDKDLNKSFERAINSEDPKFIEKSLDTLVEHRNNVAHGNISITCTIENVIDYYTKGSKVIPLLKNILETAPLPSIDTDDSDD